MFRTFACAALFIAICTLTVLAKEYKGAVTKIDTASKTITVKVDGADKVFAYGDDTSFVTSKGKAMSGEMLTKFAEKLKKNTPPVTIESAEKDAKEVAKDGNPVAAKVTFGPPK